MIDEYSDLLCSSLSFTAVSMNFNALSHCCLLWTDRSSRVFTCMTRWKKIPVSKQHYDSLVSTLRATHLKQVTKLSWQTKEDYHLWYSFWHTLTSPHFSFIANFSIYRKCRHREQNLKQYRYRKTSLSVIMDSALTPKQHVPVLYKVCYKTSSSE